MTRPPRDVPPPLELLCLKALWDLEEGNVKDVQRIVARTRPLAYTTIMTVLDRLVRKGRLTRRKQGRAFIYAPQASRDGLRRAAVRELLDGFFNGSEEELLLFLHVGQVSDLPRHTASEGQVGNLPEAAPSTERRAASPSVDSGIDTVLL